MKPLSTSSPKQENSSQERMGLATMNCYDEMIASTRSIAPSMRSRIDDERAAVSAVKKRRKKRDRKQKKNSDDNDVDLILNQPCKSLSAALVQGKIGPLPECLYEGIPVLKVHRTAQGQIMGKRILTLSRDHLAWFITHQKVQEKNSNDSFYGSSLSCVSSSLGSIPFWTPSKGWTIRKHRKKLSRCVSGDTYMRYLDIADMDHVQTGVVGNKVLEQPNINAKLAKHDVSSLVTIFHHGYTETLNLVIENQQHRQAVVASIQKLVQVYQTVVPCISSTSLLLRYIWYDVDLDRNAQISKQEFQKICTRINLGKSAYAIADSFDDFLLTHPLNATNKKRFSLPVLNSANTGFSFRRKLKTELTYGECMQLLQQIRDDIWSPLLQPKTKMKKTLSKQTAATTPRISLWDNLFGMQEDNITPKLTVTPDEVWQKFLIKCQSEETSTLEDAIHLVQSLQDVDLDNNIIRSPRDPSSVLLTKAQFEEFLLSKYNSAYDPALLNDPTTTRHADDYFKKPISQYWINTSHNTYLTGDQIQSKSSVQAYSLALFRGCKCLELDCWDGASSPANEKKKIAATHQPVVFHGHTFTSKISFRSILEVVQNYVQANPTGLPIILSLENHCSHPFQRTMAHDLKEVFGSNLYVPPRHPPPSKTKITRNHHLLPSPDELRGKVVIKGKRPPDAEDNKQQNQYIKNMSQAILVKVGSNDEATSDDDDDEEEEDPYEITTGRSEEKEEDNVTAVTKGAKEDSIKTKISKKPTNNKKQKQKPPKIVRELAELTLFHGTKYKSFEKSIEEATSHMHSIGEAKISKILSSSSGSDAKNGNSSNDISHLWRRYNHNHMTRTYPAGFRVDSSNYNPTLAWAMGCQLVALNFQTPDPPLLLNDGRFRQSGNTGYVHKCPSLLLRTPSRGFSSSFISPSATFDLMMVRIQIVSGHCLPKPKAQKEGEEIDPYVVVDLHDVRVGVEGKEECISDEFRTTSVKNNGFCPTWGWSKSTSSADSGGNTDNKKQKNDTARKNAKTFEVHRPEVAMILFQVVDEDLGFDDKIASAAIPVNCLREGYRSVQLFDDHCHSRTGPFQYANLLVNIEIIDGNDDIPQGDSNTKSNGSDAARRTTPSKQEKSAVASGAKKLINAPNAIMGALKDALPSMDISKGATNKEKVTPAPVTDQTPPLVPPYPPPVATNSETEVVDQTNKNPPLDAGLTVSKKKGQIGVDVKSKELMTGDWHSNQHISTQELEKGDEGGATRKTTIDPGK